jgi:hypothetical protein
MGLFTVATATLVLIGALAITIGCKKFVDFMVENVENPVLGLTGVLLVLTAFCTVWIYVVYLIARGLGV